VYSRVSSFVATLYRDVEAMRRERVLTPETHIVLVAHGLSARTFLMRWFQLPVSDFELLSNQPNGSILVLERHQNEAGEQWYELTRDSWRLLNSDGLIDLRSVRAHGVGFGSRRLVRQESAADTAPLDG
jgi:broad specificity phosphatase PhoE